MGPNHAAAPAVAAEAPGGDGGRFAGRHPRLMRLTPLVAPTLLVAVLLGPHLVGARTLVPADQLFNWQPWTSERPAGLTPTHNAPLSDVFDAVYPTRDEVVDRMRTGDVPLWSSAAGGGTDLATNVGTAAFAPSNAAALVTPVWYAPALMKAFEIFAAWGFVFLFVRRVGARRIPASFAGIVFAVSGFQVVWTGWPHTRVAAMVAGVLWALDRVAERVEPQRIACAAVLVAATVLEGFPAVAAVGFAAVGVVVVVRLAHFASGVGDAVRRLAALASSVVLGGALTAIVSVPFGARLSEISESRSVPDNLSIARAFGTLFAPNALGPGERYFGPLNYIETAGYLGGVAVVVIVAGCVAQLVTRRWDQIGVLAVFTTVAGGLLVAYSFGLEPLYDAMRGLPVLSFNSATRVKAAGLLLLAIASGLALDRISLVKLSRAGRWLVWSVTVAAAVAVGVYLNGFAVRSRVEMADYIRPEITRALIVLGLAVLTVLVVTRRRADDSMRGRLSLALVALTMADAVAWVVPFWPRAEPEQLFPVTDAHQFMIDELGDDRFASLGVTFFPATGAVYGLRTTTGHLFHRSTWVDALEQAGALMRSPTFSSFENPASASSPMLDRLGTTYWADPAGLARCDGSRRVAAPARSRGTRTSRVSVDAVGPGLRGITIVPGETVPKGTELSATAVDGTGTRHTGALRLDGDRVVGQPLMAPIPGIEEAEGPFRLTLDLSTPVRVLPNVSPCFAQDDGLTFVHASGAWIYRREQALDRVHWAPDFQVETNPRRRLARLSSGELDPDVVLLDEPLDEAGSSESGGNDGRGERSRSGDGASGRVVESHDDGDRQRIVVDADGPGFVVVADALQDGWNATVDGEPVDVLAADHAGVAVRIDAGGRHEIELTAEPRGFRAGVLVTALAGAIVAGLFVAGLTRRRGRYDASVTSSR